MMHAIQCQLRTILPLAGPRIASFVTHNSNDRAGRIANRVLGAYGFLTVTSTSAVFWNARTECRQQRDIMCNQQSKFQVYDASDTI